MYNCHYSWGVVPCITAVGKFFYGMDATNPAVQQYVRDTLHLVVEGWGFEYLKLDFLYSAVLGARDGTLMNRTKSGAQAMAEGMDLVRDTLLSIKKDDKEAAAAVTLLGCGAALGSTIGKVHINRISADAGLTWHPSLGPIPISDKWNLPSATNMVRNTINRLCMHNRWWINDPDCIIMREKGTFRRKHSYIYTHTHVHMAVKSPSLELFYMALTIVGTSFTDDEIVGIAVVKALSGGPLIISDDLAQVPSSRARIMQQIIPPIGVAATPIDLLHREMPELLRLQMDGWTLLGVCNWEVFIVFVILPYLSILLINKIMIMSIDHHSVSFMKEYSMVHWIPIQQLYSSDDTKKKPYRLHVLNFFKESYRCIDLLPELDFASDQDLFESDVIASHCSDLLAIRPEYRNEDNENNNENTSVPIYIGSNFHYSCGLELKNMEYVCEHNHRHVTLEFERGYMNKYKSNNKDDTHDEDKRYANWIWIYLPCSKKEDIDVDIVAREERKLQMGLGDDVVDKEVIEVEGTSIVILQHGSSSNSGSDETNGSACADAVGSCGRWSKNKKAKVVAGGHQMQGVVLKIALLSIDIREGPDLEICW